MERSLIHRALVGHRARRSVHDPLTVPIDGQPAGVVDLTDHDCFDIPLAAVGHEVIDLVRSDDGTHALLRLAHQDLFRAQCRIAQQYSIQPHVHATVTVGGEFAGGARDTGTTEVLNPLDQSGMQHFEGGLDQEFLHERIAHLHAGALGWAFVVEGFRGQNRYAPDAIAAGAGAVEHHQIAHALRARQVNVLVSHGANTQGVHQWVARVGLVEDDFPSDVGQTEAVSVATHARDDPGEDSFRIRRIGGSEAKRIHHRERTCTHRQDVANNAAHAGRRSLIRLHVRRVVVAFDFERHRPAISDVDDACVLPDPHQERIRRRSLLTELPQVHLAGLV